jgi:pre-mRNA-splicing factor 38A
VFAAESLVDEAVKLKEVGGAYGGNNKPTPFICLVLKMLQLQPEKDIIVEFIKNEDYRYVGRVSNGAITTSWLMCEAQSVHGRYVRALGAIYMRLVGSAVDIYSYLEPLYYDYRKIKFKSMAGMHYQPIVSL